MSQKFDAKLKRMKNPVTFKNNKLNLFRTLPDYRTCMSFIYPVCNVTISNNISRIPYPLFISKIHSVNYCRRCVSPVLYCQKKITYFDNKISTFSSQLFNLGVGQCFQASSLFLHATPSFSCMRRRVFPACVGKCA